MIEREIRDLARVEGNPSLQSLEWLARADRSGLDVLSAYLDQLDVEIVPNDHAQSLLAIQAFDRYGKGRHQARLNFGDCFVYALAKLNREPLLFVGDDFSKTDVMLA